MRRFAAFVADSATADAQAATLARMNALGKVQAVDLNVLDVPTRADVEERLPDLHAAITAAASVWTARHTWVSQALQTGNWSPSQNRFLSKQTSIVSSPPKLLRSESTPIPCGPLPIPLYAWR